MDKTTPNDSRKALFADRNFRWLLSGSIISMLGDQFSLIALPWLVLGMTGDTLVLGTVLALMSVPRALFILVGGALVDRHSPKRVLMLTKYANTVLLGALAVLVLNGALHLWVVYGFALAIGLATAFSIPAGTSIMPHAVPREHLQAANSIFMGVRQLSMFAGPLLAGLLIAWFGGDAAAGLKDAKGIGLAFLADAATFAVSSWTLAKVAMQEPAEKAASNDTGVWKAVAEGIRYCWNERSLRLCFTYWAAVAFFISGPVQVAIPVLATKVGDSAAAFGALAAAHGAGTLLGMLATEVTGRMRLVSFGTTILVIDGIIGILFMPLGFVEATWQGSILLLLIGALGGFLQVKVYTWLQRASSPALLGRTMALFMFIFMGIAPMSSAATGLLMQYVSLAQVFAGSGVLLVAIVLIAYLGSGMPNVAETSASPGTPA